MSAPCKNLNYILTQGRRRRLHRQTASSRTHTHPGTLHLTRFLKDLRLYSAHYRERLSMQNVFWVGRCESAKSTAGFSHNMHAVSSTQSPNTQPKTTPQQDLASYYQKLSKDLFSVYPKGRPPERDSKLPKASNTQFLHRASPKKIRSYFPVRGTNCQSSFSQRKPKLPIFESLNPEREY